MHELTNVSVNIVAISITVCMNYETHFVLILLVYSNPS